jgi:hypothetical protein
VIVVTNGNGTRRREDEAIGIELETNVFGCVVDRESVSQCSRSGTVGAIASRSMEFSHSDTVV